MKQLRKYFLFFILLSFIASYLPAIPASAAGNVDTRVYEIHEDLSRMSNLYYGWTANDGKQHYYSKNDKIEYTSTKFSVKDYVTDLKSGEKIKSVKLEAQVPSYVTEGGLSASCSTEICTTKDGISLGTALEIPLGTEEIKTSFLFDWWRNHDGGPRAFFWTYDSPKDGSTITSKANGGLGEGAFDSRVKGNKARMDPGGQGYEDQHVVRGSGFTFYEMDSYTGELDLNAKVPAKAVYGAHLVGEDIAIANPDFSDVSMEEVKVYTDITFNTEKINTFFSYTDGLMSVSIPYKTGTFKNADATEIVPRAARYPEAIGLRYATAFQTPVYAYTYSYIVSWKMNVEIENAEPVCNPAVEDCGGPNIPNGTCAPAPLSTTNRNGVTLTDSRRVVDTVKDLTTDPKASIRAVARDNEKFDVEKSIPSGEYLYENITDARRYLVEYCYETIDGTASYTATVTNSGNAQENGYIYHTSAGSGTWSCPTGQKTCSTPSNDTVSVGDGIVGYSNATSRSYSSDGTYTDYYNGVSYSNNPQSQSTTRTRTQPYSYKKLLGYAVYRLDSAKFENPILEGKTVTLLSGDKVWGSLVEKASVSTNTSGGVTPTASSTSKTNGSCASRGSCNAIPSFDESQITLNVEVKSDTLTVDGCTYTMGKSTCGTYVDRNVMFNNNELIDIRKPNGVYASKAGITYVYDQGANYPGAQSRISFPLTPNKVIVLTPVVNYDVLACDNRNYDQSSASHGMAPLVLGGKFCINFTNTGQHVDHKGYGNKEYSPYTEEKRVRFPFDAFKDSTFYPANTWIPVSLGNQEFKVAEWAEEGTYNIESQSWAKNDSSGKNSNVCQQYANTDLVNYCANNFMPVKVVGRIYDFRVFDVSDFRFEEVFRTAKGSMTHTDKYYYAGNADKWGNWTQRPGVLPVMPGSVSAQPKLVAHNGYSFSFDFKTLGGYYGAKDGVVVTPSFKYVSKSGGTAQPVDLYYNTSSSGLIKIGSTQDEFSRTVRLMDPRNNINTNDTSTENFQCTVLNNNCNWDREWKDVISKVGARKTIISGDYVELYLNNTMRRLEGLTEFAPVPSNADKASVAAGLQHWYGEYSLPVGVKALPKGTNIQNLANKYGSLTGREDEFLTNGYIVVNLSIDAYRNENYDNPELSYKSSSTNMWAIEGQQTTRNVDGKVYDFEYGDVMFFDIDFSASNDFQS